MHSLQESLSATIGLTRKSQGGKTVSLWKPFSFFLAAICFSTCLVVPCTAAEKVRVCVPYPSSDVGFLRDCTQKLGQANDDEVEFECVEGGSADKCISMLGNEEAEVTTLEAGDVYHVTRQHGMSVILIEHVRKGTAPGEVYAVAVVEKDFCTPTSSLADLKGLRSCHSGYKKMAGWYIPVGALKQEVEGFGDLPETANDNIEDDAELVANFFDKTCAPRVRDGGPRNTRDGGGRLWKEGLCSACLGDCTTKDIYYGDSGAFRCLTEKNGDVAFIKHTTVIDYASDGIADETLRAWSKRPMSDFRLLCKDGGCKEVTDWKSCNLAPAVGHSMVASPDLSLGGSRTDLATAITKAITNAGEEYVVDTRALLSGTDFLWTAGAETVIAFETPFLDELDNEGLFDTLRAYENIGANSVKGDKTVVKVCIPYPPAVSRTTEVAFVRKCNAAVKQANTPILEFECVEGGSIDKCIEMIRFGEAHVTTLDAGDVFTTGELYEFAPIVVEDTDEEDIEGSHFAVAVVPKKFCESGTPTFADLRGKKACSPGYKKMAGWYFPISALIRDGDDFLNANLRGRDVEQDAQMFGAYFSKICAPGVGRSGPRSDNGTNLLWSVLCTACKGDCSSKDIYYDAIGAFRCLTEGSGDVAFLDHTTVLQYASDGSADESLRSWSEKPMSDFKLLCETGGCSDVTDYKGCAFGETPGRALVVGPNFAKGGEEESLGEAIAEAIIEASNTTPFLKETRGLRNSFLWSSHASTLRKSDDDYFTFESRLALEAFEQVFIPGQPFVEVDERMRANFCAKDDAESRFCRKVVRILNSQAPDFVWGCYTAQSSEGCLEAIASGDAEWTTADVSDLRLGFNKYGLTAVVGENRGIDRGGSYYSVAVVHKKICSDNMTLKDLKGKKSCHTGYRKASGWDVPLGRMISSRVMDVVDEDGGVENDAESAAKFFGTICAARVSDNGPKNTADGQGETWQKMCTGCKGGCGTNDVYYGYSGALTCLTQGGDVLFTRHTSIPQDISRVAPGTDRDDFKLVCWDKEGCYDIDEYAKCHLARLPAHAVVVEFDSKLIRGSKFQNALVAASKTKAFADLVFDPVNNENNYMFSNDLSELVRIDTDMVTYLSDAENIYATLEDIRSGNWDNKIDDFIVNEDQNVEDYGAMSKAEFMTTVLFFALLSLFVILW